MPADPFSGRRVLVTGAAGAFGAATCAALRRRGASVAGLDVVPRDGVIDCDITDPAAVTDAVARAQSTLGGIDRLVHFAGIGEPTDAGAEPGPAAQRTVAVNLFGPWRVTAAALPALLRARGRVVFVASELAYATLPFAAAYAVSKRGLTAYADALRMEYGTHLQVTTVYPGYVRTPIHDASAAAGLSMEGQVRREEVDDIVATVLRALSAPRPRRDTAATRAGNVELWLARHLPRLVDGVIHARVVRDMRRGRYDGVPLARRVVGLHVPGRGGGGGASGGRGGNGEPAAGPPSDVDSATGRAAARRNGRRPDGSYR